MRLFAFNRNVDAFNESKLASLSSPPVVFNAEDSGSYGRSIRYRILWRTVAVVSQLQRALAAATEVWRAGDAPEEPGRGARACEWLSWRRDIIPSLVEWIGRVASGAMDGRRIRTLASV